MKLDEETFRFLERMVSMAVNEECSCGGRGPDDPGVCPACMVYHHLFNNVSGYLFGNKMAIEKDTEEKESPWRGIVVCLEGAYYCNDKYEVIFTDKITTRDIAITRELFSCGEEE